MSRSTAPGERWEPSAQPLAYRISDAARALGVSVESSHIRSDERYVRNQRPITCAGGGDMVNSAQQFESGSPGRLQRTGGEETPRRYAQGEYHT